MICDVGLLLAQVARHAGDRPARPDAHDEVREPPARLAPQLRPGRLVVRLRVGRVGVLVGLERPGDLLREPVGDAVVGLRRVGRHVGGSDHHLGAVRAQEVDLLLAHLVRHHRDHAVALQARGDGEPGAGVPARRLDDRAARPQPPVPLRRLHEPDRDTVLDRATGIERLELGHDLRRQPRADPAQPDQRRLTDGVEDRVLDVCGLACGGRAHGSDHRSSAPTGVGVGPSSCPPGAALASSRLSAPGGHAADRPPTRPILERALHGRPCGGRHSIAGCSAQFDVAIGDWSRQIDKSALRGTPRGGTDLNDRCAFGASRARAHRLLQPRRVAGRSDDGVAGLTASADGSADR